MRLFKSLLFQPSPREWWGCLSHAGHPLSPPTTLSHSPGHRRPDSPTCRGCAPEPRGRHLRWVPGPPAGVAQGTLRGAASSWVMTQRCPGVWRSPRGSSHTPAPAEGGSNHSVFYAGSGPSISPQSFAYPHRLQEPAVWTDGSARDSGAWWPKFES